MSERTIFFLSDQTGVTAETLGHSLMTQFDSHDFRQVTLPFIDSEDKAREAVGKVDEAAAKGISLADGDNQIDDVLTYALFPQIGLKFLANRGNADMFEPAPTGKESSIVQADNGDEIYTVNVEGSDYTVTVNNGGELTGIVPLSGAAGGEAPAVAEGSGEPVKAPLAGNIFRVMVSPGQQVAEGDTLLVLEAMKMETQVSAPSAGTVSSVNIKEGDVVAVGDVLLSIA